MAGFHMKGFLKNPDAMDRMGAIGLALSGLDQGRAVDLSGYRQSIEERQANAPLGGSAGMAGLEQQGLLEKFTPEQRAMLAQMPRSAAMKIIQESAFAPPDPMEQLRTSGALNRFTPEQQQVLMSLPPDQAQKIIAESAFATPEPVKGIEVGGNVVNPIDGAIIYEGQPEAGHKVLTAEEAQQLNLPSGSYQQAPDGKITSIGNRGQTINVNTGGAEQNVIDLDPKGGRALISDPASQIGVRSVEIPGGAAARETEKGSAQAALMLNTIDGLLADPGLEEITGLSGVMLGEGDSLTSRAALAANPEAARAMSRHKQIQGQVFLDAYESLRGAGQITEIEGQKAEAARARLMRAQSPEDYRAALMELREIVTLANSRPVGWVEAQGQPTAPTATMSDDELLQFHLGGGQ